MRSAPASTTADESRHPGRRIARNRLSGGQLLSGLLRDDSIVSPTSALPDDVDFANLHDEIAPGHVAIGRHHPRSLIWSASDGRLQVLFHQGTLVTNKYPPTPTA